MGMATRTIGFVHLDNGNLATFIDVGMCDTDFYKMCLNLKMLSG